MQSRSRYTLMRRILFPYSGEEPLSRAQGLRVIAAWILVFAPGMSLFTLLVAVVATLPLQKTLLLLLLSFLSGVVIFGILSWLVVAMSNRAARIFQARRATRTSISGGRYGS